MRALLAAALALGLLGAAAAAASAAWGPGAEVVSVDNARLEQGDGPVSGIDITPDGRYVVFATRATNFFPDGDADQPGTLRRGGVFRYDRATGALALVADGDLIDEGSGQVLRRGAATPSVSADGRFVAFSTGQRLTPADLNENVDVYVRDMLVPLAADRQAGTPYRLVSALDGVFDGAVTYEPRDPPLPGRTPGTAVWPGTSISDDGRYVAFRTVEQQSNLADPATVDTPAGTVFVRDVAASRTVLVSRDRVTGEPVGGAEQPVVLSGDGTTVAWVGVNVGRQARFLEGEGAGDQIPFYLWRRWSELGAETRRVTGATDPDDPACPPGSSAGTDPTSMGPCDGPLTEQEQGLGSITSAAPALSTDGRTVAFLSGANLRPFAETNPALDVFVTSMAPGVSRKAATRQITRDTLSGNARANGPVEGVALSGDGRRLAFTSTRTSFLLSSPVFIGTPRTSEGGPELYVVDLDTDRVERAALARGGGDALGAVGPQVSMTGDGRRVAFTSTAEDLFVGDANGHADAFVAAVQPPAPARPPAAGVTQAPVALDVVTDEEPAIASTARRLRDGRVELRVRTPAAGSVIALAETRRVPRTGRAARRLARVSAKATKAQTVRLRLGLRGADRRRVLRGTSVPARVTVTFTPAVENGRRLRERVDVTFKRTLPARRPVKRS